MGTSKSSKGSPSNVPSTPSWTPDPLEGGGQNNVTYAPHNTGTPVGGPDFFSENDFPVSPESIEFDKAPPRRHLGARKGISDYARTGSRDSLQRGMKNYVKKSLGGSRKAAQRLGGATKSAGSLYHALSSLSGANDFNENDLLSREALSSKSPAEIIDYIVDTLAPLDGTQDAETRQWSMNNALSDLYKTYPNADIENLTVEQIDHTVECFAVEELIRRFELDLEQTIIDNAPSNMEGVKRSKDAKSFIRTVAHNSFEELRESGKTLTTDNVTEVINEAYIITCEGFEES
ncbi:Qat anti-phage system associated protein QatB [Halobacteriovorax sp. XZX-3]|uniref:Qat anti-phage system associated protein QatB n=1 Tax=unclassified Halobacteriovorax TaxID=2639665 RepID=UPI0037171840